MSKTLICNINILSLFSEYYYTANQEVHALTQKSSSILPIKLKVETSAMYVSRFTKNV